MTENMKTVVCDFCGTLQTVPSVKDENLQGLFNRANILRMKSEFDKAEQIYEKIVQTDSTQAEAYWGLILCKFGVEYVEDPGSFKRIPTCHRTLLDSIIADDDYKSALNYADSIQREIYESEAKEIDRIQKEIITLSKTEEPYDVFICYKETDDAGNRTYDSVIANDIYYQLIQEGFKVFYAAITLEDKLGSAYEPCIFAALNSAKVMLVIGTKPEYFSAVWVKNEWSRYLKIIKKDRSKVLIPCYKDMDAYELPNEFAHIQAQDMSKIGFISDVVRGIKKVLSSGNTETERKKVAVDCDSNLDDDINPLVQRAFIFLEDGNWTSADEYCEKVLDSEPKNAYAYLGKLMAELKVKTQSELADCKKALDDNGNYQKAVRFADLVLKNKLTDINASIKERIRTSDGDNTLFSMVWESLYDGVVKDIENAKQFEAEKNYIEAYNLYKSAQKSFADIVEYDSAEKRRKTFAEYRDGRVYVDLCTKKIEELGTRINPTLKLVITDSSNPLSLANGCIYKYTIIKQNDNKQTNVTLKLVKGIVMQEIRLETGDYSVKVEVYGSGKTDEKIPMYTASGFVKMGHFENWKAISNRPLLFSKLRLSFERIR